jgi:hypothetical protein
MDQAQGIADTLGMGDEMKEIKKAVNNVDVESIINDPEKSIMKLEDLKT